MADRTKCVVCGRFMGAAAFEGGHCHFEPLSEFGSEILEWTCTECVGREAGEDERWAAQQPSAGAMWHG